MYGIDEKEDEEMKKNERKKYETIFHISFSS
jgi:hypothetical protein